MIQITPSRTIYSIQYLFFGLFLPYFNLYLYLFLYSQLVHMHAVIRRYTHFVVLVVQRGNYIINSVFSAFTMIIYTYVIKIYLSIYLSTGNIKNISTQWMY